MTRGSSRIITLHGKKRLTQPHLKQHQAATRPRGTSSRAPRTSPTTQKVLVMRQQDHAHVRMSSSASRENHLITTTQLRRRNYHDRRTAFVVFIVHYNAAATIWGPLRTTRQKPCGPCRTQHISSDEYWNSKATHYNGTLKTKLPPRC